MPVPGTVAERGATTRDADIGVTASSQPYSSQSDADQKLAEKIVKRQGWLEDNRALTDAAKSSARRERRKSLDRSSPASASGSRGKPRGC